MAKSTAKSRTVQAYPSPVIFKLLVAESELAECSRSTIVSEALKQYYDRMPEVEKRRLLNALR